MQLGDESETNYRTVLFLLLAFESRFQSTVADRVTECLTALMTMLTMKHQTFPSMGMAPAPGNGH